MAARTLTLLFTDIVCSTALWAEIGEREAHRVRHWHFAVMGEEIERHDGRQVKTLGDGVMASFEAAGDAIAAAVAMQLSNDRERARESRSRLSLRIGVSSGDVRVEDGDCFGAPVVEASRLCARAAGGQVLLADSTRLIAGGRTPLLKVGDVALKGLAEPMTVWEAPWTPGAEGRLRVVLADDAVLVREGIARVLDEFGIDVVAQAGDADELLRATDELHPDLAIVDVRMPPTHTGEGVAAAELILARHPRTAVLILSNELEPHYAERLLAARPSGVGYLLKERVSDVRALRDAAWRVSSGETVFEPALGMARLA